MAIKIIKITLVVSVCFTVLYFTFIGIYFQDKSHARSISNNLLNFTLHFTAPFVHLLQVANVSSAKGSQSYKHSRTVTSSESTARLLITTSGVKDQTTNNESQTLSNVTRPLVCKKCFFTEFSPLMSNVDVCKTRSNVTDIKIVMLVITTHGATDRRQSIRQTWASVTENNTANVRHVFVLGRSKVESAMMTVRKEQMEHGDMVMFDFLDSYANLTLKTMSALRWTVAHCRSAKFFLKVDDDMWINMVALKNVIEKEGQSLQTAIGGQCRGPEGPIRDVRSKWHATFQMYPRSKYPRFCSGTAYISSLHVARQVVSISPDVPFFHLEDVYMALCLENLGNGYSTLLIPGFLTYTRELCVLKSNTTISAHEIPPEQLRRIWTATCG